MLCSLVVDKGGSELADEDEERDHGEDDHGEAVHQLPRVRAEVQRVEPQVDGVLGHHVLAGRLARVLLR